VEAALGLSRRENALLSSRRDGDEEPRGRGEAVWIRGAAAERRQEEWRGAVVGEAKGRE